MTHRSAMDSCVYCRASLHPGPPWAPGEGRRLAYDPGKGRLWDVCTSCGRWNLVPLEERWESLEACEGAVRTRGTVVLATRHLSLVRVGEGELIRIGEPPRVEFVEWRYGPRLPLEPSRPGFWARLLSGLPAPPVDGYDPYGNVLRPASGAPWIASPFLEHASALTYLFSQVPFAPACPSCGRPMPLKPWALQEVRLLHRGKGPELEAPCAFCGDQVILPLAPARPTLRLALSLVTPPALQRELALPAARALDVEGGAAPLLRFLASERATLGELDPLERAGLIISLDELAEAEALEAEWRQAEEMAAIMDGELTEVPGFEDFRNEILDPNH